MAVQAGQSPLPEYQHMAAGDGTRCRLARGDGRCFQRAPEFVDEIFAVRQAGDRILVQLQFQRFDLGVLLFDAGIYAFAGLVQGLHDAGQLRHAGFHLLGRRVLADAADVVADFAQQAVLDPAHQHKREPGPQAARAHDEWEHLQAAAPQGLPGRGIVGEQGDFADLAPAAGTDFGVASDLRSISTLPSGSARRTSEKWPPSYSADTSNS
ncbi:hypothetical protein G6F57_019744 [Rhizopus arrhizus]|nr:hypothetical protein G6F57_019744 [Rhizopus arrhizus]